MNNKNLVLIGSCFRLISCLTYSSTLKMEPTCSSETSVDFQRTRQRYIPKDRSPLNKILSRNNYDSSILAYCLIFNSFKDTLPNVWRFCMHGNCNWLGFVSIQDAEKWIWRQVKKKTLAVYEVPNLGVITDTWLWKKYQRFNRGNASYICRYERVSNNLGMS
jgi:hypothetical protein